MKAEAARPLRPQPVKCHFHHIPVVKASGKASSDSKGRGRKLHAHMFALPHSGVLWPSGLPAPFPHVWGQLYCGRGCALQLHWQADSGGKRHPHVWAGRTLDRLPAPLLRYGAGVGERGPRERLANGRWTSPKG